MTDATLTHLYFLLDRSGSMHSMQADTKGGFDAFIGDQRATPGRCLVTLAQFDDSYDVVYTDRDLAEVPPLELVPRGSTALLDALGRLITTAGERLAALPEDQRPGSVVVGVMTDGLENVSREWSQPRIKALIEQQDRDYGWQFLYLGADQDAVEEGMKMGFAAGKSMTYSRGKAKQSLSHLSANVGAYREAVAAGAPSVAAKHLTDFTDDQRADAAD
ncbi:MAG: vWA domain-containing protein [Nocardioides sp.]